MVWFTVSIVRWTRKHQRRFCTVTFSMNDDCLVIYEIVLVGINYIVFKKTKNSSLTIGNGFHSNKNEIMLQIKQSIVKNRHNYMGNMSLGVI